MMDGIVEFLADLLWARARIVLESGRCRAHWTRAAWRYMAFSGHPPTLAWMAYGIRYESELARFEPKPEPARVADLDGIEHFTSGACGCEDECGHCGGRSHYQAVYDGYVVVCEDCDADAHYWREYSG